MQLYRLFFFRDGHIVKSHAFEAADEAAALIEAAAIADGETYELWSGKRMVKVRETRQGDRPA